jgi:hypothetical protein
LASTYFGRCRDNCATEDAKIGFRPPGDRGWHEPPCPRILQPTSQDNMWNQRLKKIARTGQAGVDQCHRVWFYSVNYCVIFD